MKIAGEKWSMTIWLLAGIAVVLAGYIFWSKKIGGNLIVNLTPTPTATGILTPTFTLTNNVLDFGACVAGGQLSSSGIFYKEKIQIAGPYQNQCSARVTRETQGGNFIYNCQVPFSVGKVVFVKAYFGPIEKYCRRLTPDEAL